jgi:hypothetical protein
VLEADIYEISPRRPSGWFEAPVLKEPFYEVAGTVTVRCGKKRCDPDALLLLTQEFLKSRISAAY